MTLQIDKYNFTKDGTQSYRKYVLKMEKKNFSQPSCKINTGTVVWGGSDLLHLSMWQQSWSREPVSGAGPKVPVFLFWSRDMSFIIKRFYLKCKQHCWAPLVIRLPKGVCPFTHISIIISSPLVSVTVQNNKVCCFQLWFSGTYPKNKHDPYIFNKSG